MVKKKLKLTKEERKAKRLAKKEAARLRKAQREIQAKKVMTSCYELMHTEVIFLSSRIFKSAETATKFE